MRNNGEMKKRAETTMKSHAEAMMTWRNGLKDGENMMKGLNTDEQQWRNDTTGWKDDEMKRLAENMMKSHVKHRSGSKRWWNESPWRQKEIGWKIGENQWYINLIKLDNWVRETEKLKGTCSAIQSTCSVPALWQGDTKDRKRMNSKRKNQQKIGARDKTVEGHMQCFSIINLQLASILAQPY